MCIPGEVGESKQSLNVVCVIVNIDVVSEKLLFRDLTQWKGFYSDMQAAHSHTVIPGFPQRRNSRRQP